MRINKSLIAYTPTTGAGSGTVTSVGLTAPTGFTVTGSPITSSGTLAIAFTTGYGIPPLMTGNSGKFLTTNGSTMSWANIAGTDVTGAAISTSNDTNILITASGNTTNALLRTLTLTTGWTGQLAVGRGGTGASTLTGVIIGNGTSAMTALASTTAQQLLRVNTLGTAYEWFTPQYLVPIDIQASSPLVWNSTTKTMSIGTITTLGTITTGVWQATPISPSYGGTGATSITGVVIGNGIGTMTGVAGTADQLLRRNSANTAYEFFTPTYISNPMNTLGDIIVGNNLGIPARLGANATSVNKYLRSVNGTTPTWEQIQPSDIAGGVVTGSGTTNFVPIWTSSTALGNSSLSITGGEANFGSNKLVAGNVSATNGSIMLQDNYSSGHLGNIGTMYSGGNLMLGYSVTPSTSSATAFLSATSLTSWTRSAIVLGTDISFYTGAGQTVAIGSSVSMLEVLKMTNAGTLQILQGDLQLPTTKNITWGGAYGTDIPTISGTSGGGSNGFLQFYPAGSTSGVKMALRRTGQLALPSYTTSTSFTGTEVATLAVTSAGDVITIAPAQTTASGTYTPTWTGLANVGSTTAFSCQYMRVGNTVTVSGWVTIDAVTDNTPTSLSFSLPINSNTSTVNYLNGTGVQQGGGAAASLSGYGANYGEFEVIPLVDTAINYSFHFTYRII